MLESSVGYREQRFGQNPELGDGFSYSVTFVDGGGSFDFGPRYGSKQTLDQHYFTARETASLFVASDTRPRPASSTSGPRSTARTVRGCRT